MGVEISLHYTSNLIEIGVQFIFFFHYSMFCPSMCSGKGICDWSLPTPACKCFDESDTTPGCYDSDVNEQAACPTSASPSWKAGGIFTMVNLLGPMVVAAGFGTILLV